ncbi:MAG: sulfatase-like hydrolase/transferase [Rhodospirillales bacterium]|nr:sulfatase-like hydrolase/transferase [Rhodospirillales bacterium]
MVEHDGQVGQLLKKLDDRKITDNTIVIYTTDNGVEVMSWPDGCACSKLQKAEKHRVFGDAVIPSSACSRFCPPSAPCSRSGFVVASRWSTNTSPCDIR